MCFTHAIIMLVICMAEGTVKLGNVKLLRDDYNKAQRMFKDILGNRNLKELVDRIDAYTKYDGLHLDEKLSKNKSFMLFLFQLTPKAILFFDHSLFNDKDIINWLSTDEVLHKLNNFIVKDNGDNVFLLDFILNRDNLIKICKINPFNVDHCGISLQEDSSFINDLLKEGVYTAIKYEKERKKDSEYILKYIKRVDPRVYLYCDKSVQRDPIVIAALLENPYASLYVREVGAVDVIVNNPQLLKIAKTLPEPVNPISEKELKIIKSQGNEEKASDDELIKIILELKKENEELRETINEINETSKKTLYTQSEVLKLLQQMNNQRNNDGTSRS